MALRLHPGASRTELQHETGLSRHTVLRGLSMVPEPVSEPHGPRVSVPAELLADHSVKAQAKVLYGLLQATPDCRGWHGSFTYATLCTQTQLSRNALKRAIADLANSEWIRVRQTGRQRPIYFRLGSPAQRRSQAEAAVVQRRLDRPGGSTFEKIAQEILSLVIDSYLFYRNARLGLLINPMTGELLELDRYYPEHKVAFEINGEQHDRATEKFSQKQHEAQRLRDLIKAGLCVYQGIQLIIIRVEDLSIEGVLKKVGNSMPLRNLTGHGPVIAVLENACRRYLERVPKRAS